MIRRPPRSTLFPYTPLFGSHSTLLGLKASAGQVALVPVHVSATSQSPADSRHTVPAFPAGCVQALPLPSHTSRVHTLPSSVHAVSAGFTASAGQLAPLPVQNSARSHSPVAARHSTLLGLKASAGQLALVPVHVSATSQSPAVARHTVPAFPAGWVQLFPLPSHTSRVQTLPSAVHAVSDDFLASAGQDALVPVQFSAMSHSPTAERQTVAADSSWQVEEQQSPLAVLPSSHCSPASIVPLPHTE